MSRRLVRGAAVALLALAVAGIAVTLAARSELLRPYAGWSGTTHVDVTLEPGLGAGAMVDRLAAAGVLRSPWTARVWLRLRGTARSLQAGEYRFERPASALEVLARLAAGDVLLHPVTVPEGLSIAEVAARVAETGLAERSALLTAFRDPSAIRDLDPKAPDLEGYLFPETYHFARGTSAERIAAAFVERFRATALPEIGAAAAAVELSLREIVVLASLIEEETSLPEERPLVAQVFHNRLRRGMLLQCDPTVRYALERAGRPVPVLRTVDLAFDSPWNTYRYGGLPPGPIANPGLDSLRAAVGPTPGELLYFVAAPGGGHRFSRDLAGHESAVGAWRRYSRSSR